MSVPMWLFAIVLAWAIVMTVFLFVRNYLPWPDRGHRCFAVPSDHAALAVECITRRRGLGERFTFDAGFTHQTLLWDNTTVLIRYDEVASEYGLPRNAMSLVTRHPLRSANEAAHLLRALGFTADPIVNLIPELSDKFVALTSDAFDGWVMVFRRHALRMGKPPNMRRQFQ